MLIFLSLVACDAPAADSGDGAEAGDSGRPAVMGTLVEMWTDPAPVVAGEAVEFYEHVTDQDGNSLDDLQRNHERYVHTIFVSRDLASFTHTHMEDFTDPLPTDAIRASTFHFPITFPLSGEYLAIFDYARENQWIQTLAALSVAGDVSQLDAAEQDFSTTVAAGDLTVSLSWEVDPAAEVDSIWNAHITTAAGQDVTDLVPWLGADGHSVLVNEGLTWASHTHAWFPDMEGMTPSMTMPHLYSGPDLPFHYVFPAGGTYKMWVQFRRESAPDVVYAAPFMFRVSG